MGLHRTHFAAALATLAAAVAPAHGLAQDNLPFAPQGRSPFVPDDEQQQLVDVIQSVQSEAGAYALELLDPLKTLGVLYQEGGDHRLAIAANERALQVIRANFGLRAIEQAPLMQRQILNQRAIGDTEAAWQLEQELRELAARHPDDLRTVSIFREIGDERMDILRRYLRGEFPPEIYLGCYYDPVQFDDFGSCRSGSRGRVVFGLLSEAWGSYSAAINVLLRNQLYDSRELGELEQEIIWTAYRYGGYGAGRASLRRLLDYQIARGAPFVEQVEALVRLADWDLTFVDNRGAPLGLYEIAYDQLKQHGADTESIDRIFSPETPILLPSFLPNPLTANDADSASGYIDVAFELTKFGRSRAIQIVDATANTTDEDKQELEKLISRSRFRPMITDGEFARITPVVVRYYLGD